MSPAEKNRSGLRITALLACATVAAWWFMLQFPPSMDAATGETIRDGRTFGAVFFMWALMMAAMMLPAALPMIRAYDRLARDRETQRRSLAATLSFVGGYLSVWTLFSLVAALLQWGVMPILANHTLISGRVVEAVVFLFAGTYQFSALKDACLTQCRSPIGYLLGSWRKGSIGASAMGFDHGLHCLGCCWALMMVMLAVGAMNMAWMGVITLWVILEKRPTTWARALTRAIGAALVGWGGWQLLTLWLWGSI